MNTSEHKMHPTERLYACVEAKFPMSAKEREREILIHAYIREFNCQSSFHACFYGETQQIIANTEFIF
jgi:hypothetical protein